MTRHSITSDGDVGDKVYEDFVLDMPRSCTKPFMRAPAPKQRTL